MNIQERYRSLEKLVSIRDFRKEKIQVFYDFVELCALHISNRTDPGHRPLRQARLLKILEGYTQEENAFLMEKMKELVALVAAHVDQGEFRDILGRLFEELKLCDPGQDFTPHDVTALLSQLGMTDPETIRRTKGHFTYYDGTAGSGAIALSVAEFLTEHKIPYWNKMIACMVDLDRVCAHMAYVQMSMYGLSAVVVHGNTITEEEFSRWYTPMYVLGNWQWRQPFHLKQGEWLNPHDEILKSGTHPAESAALRLIRWPEEEKNA